jgi:hypothetical protein
VIDAATRLPLTNPSEAAVQGQILSLLSEAYAHRETRTFQLGLGLPSVVWAELVLFSVFLTVFVVMAGVDPNPLPRMLILICQDAS